MKANTRPSGAANTKHEYVFGWKCPLLILCSSSFLWRTSPFSAPRRTVCCPLCAAPTVNTLTDVCSLVGKTTASVARCWGVGVETEKGLLCNSGRAIPRTGGRGRGLVTEDAPAACQADKHSRFTQKHNLYTKPRCLLLLHTLALLSWPVLRLFGGKGTWRNVLVVHRFRKEQWSAKRWAIQPFQKVQLKMSSENGPLFLTTWCMKALCSLFF